TASGRSSAPRAARASRGRPGSPGSRTTASGASTGGACGPCRCAPRAPGRATTSSSPAASRTPATAPTPTSSAAATAARTSSSRCREPPTRGSPPGWRPRRPGAATSSSDASPAGRRPRRTAPPPSRRTCPMRLVVARCSARYTGRLSAHLPLATRVLIVKADGSVLLHSDGGSYKPLNWMSPQCTLAVREPSEEARERGVTEVWAVQHAKRDDRLEIELHEVQHDSSHELGIDPGLVKDGVEAHLQEMLAAQIELLGSGHTLVRREYPTAIGPVDILAKDADGGTVAVEIKRRGDIDGVEQLT